MAVFLFVVATSSVATADPARVCANQIAEALSSRPKPQEKQPNAWGCGVQNAFTGCKASAEDAVADGRHASARIHIVGYRPLNTSVMYRLDLLVDVAIVSPRKNEPLRPSVNVEYRNPRLARGSNDANLIAHIRADNSLKWPKTLDDMRELVGELRKRARRLAEEYPPCHQ